MSWDIHLNQRVQNIRYPSLAYAVKRRNTRPQLHFRLNTSH